MFESEDKEICRASFRRSSRADGIDGAVLNIPSNETS